MNKWLVASYKIKEIIALERNLKNQEFRYYLPRIMIRDINFRLKEEVLFPGYIFVNIKDSEYHSLSYTKGIKRIIKFGNNICFMDSTEIEQIQKLESSCQKQPFQRIVKIGQDVKINKGSLKGNLVKICSLPQKDRVDIFVNMLGLKRKINIKLKYISV